MKPQEVLDNFEEKSIEMSIEHTNDPNIILELMQGIEAARHKTINYFCKIHLDILLDLQGNSCKLHNQQKYPSIDHQDTSQIRQDK